MRTVTDRTSNPFGQSPPCEAFVPGYGDANADFHVIGDHPTVHGGVDTGIPFTGMPWSTRFFDALAAAGLVETVDLPAGTLVLDRTYLSYLHQCVSETVPPSEVAYAELEPFFDAELRAITADVLLPVGERATEHVLATFTARDPGLASDLDAIHGTELVGSGWLVVPVKEPAEWDVGDADRLVDGLQALQRTDYHREAELGRFLVGGEPYHVR